MPPMSLPAVPAGADAPADAATSIAPGTAFIDRAQQMVAFLAARDGGRDGTRGSPPEDELVQWISQWRGMRRRGPDGTDHFVAEELGIIARALNGPAHGNRPRPERTDELCWLIARCMHRRA